MFTYQFWRQSLERAFKTFLQTLVALLSVNGIGLLNAPWLTALSAAGMAALLSLLTSMASEPVGERKTPSLVRPDPEPARLGTPVHVGAPVHQAPHSSIPA